MWKYYNKLASHASFTIVSSAIHLLHGIIEKTYMDVGNC